MNKDINPIIYINKDMKPLLKYIKILNTSLI